MSDPQPHKSTNNSQAAIRAMVVIVVLLLAVAAIFVFSGENSGPIAEWDWPDEASPTPGYPGSNGVAVEREVASSTPAASTADLPAGLVPSAATVLENESSSLGMDATQRIVLLQINRPIAELAAEYQQILEQQGFTISETLEDQYGNRITAQRNSDDIVISINDDIEDAGDASRVSIDYQLTN